MYSMLASYEMYIGPYVNFGIGRLGFARVREFIYLLFQIVLYFAKSTNQKLFILFYFILYGFILYQNKLNFNFQYAYN